MEELGKQFAKVLEGMMQAASIIGANAERLWPQVVLLTAAEAAGWILFNIVAIIIWWVLLSKLARVVNGFIAAFESEYVSDYKRVHGADKQPDTSEFSVAKGVINATATIVICLAALGYAAQIPGHLATVVAPEARTVLNLADAAAKTASNASKR